MFSCSMTVNTSDSPLETCLLGQTQNSNDAINKRYMAKMHKDNIFQTWPFEARDRARAPRHAPRDSKRRDLSRAYTKRDLKITRLSNSTFKTKQMSHLSERRKLIQFGTLMKCDMFMLPSYY